MATPPEMRSIEIINRMVKRVEKTDAAMAEELRLFGEAYIFDQTRLADTVAGNGGILVFWFVHFIQKMLGHPVNPEDDDPEMRDTVIQSMRDLTLLLGQAVRQPANRTRFQSIMFLEFAILVVVAGDIILHCVLLFWR